MADSETDPGGWKDFSTGEGGSMAELAEQLGIDPRRSIRSTRERPHRQKALPGRGLPNVTAARLG